MTPYEVLLTIKECLCLRLADTLAGPVCRCTAYPSPVPTADICSKSLTGNGQAIVAVTNVYNSQTFPDPDIFVNCDSYRVYEITQTVWRCAPTISDSGKLPSEEAVELATMEVLEDAEAMRCAIMCCGDFSLVSLGTWTLQEMAGGCMGGQLVSLIGVSGEPCAPLGSV